MGAGKVFEGLLQLYFVVEVVVVVVVGATRGATLGGWGWRSASFASV